MKRTRLHAKGFTLIASLLLLLLLSGMAIGLMMMVNTEGRVGGTDLQNNLAFHAAEGGIEKMYSDLSVAITNAQSPTIADICGVNGLAPTMMGVNFPLYQVQVTGKNGSTAVNCQSSASLQNSTAPANTWGQISSGPNQGLYALIIPINMTVTASMLGGQEVSMTRGAQIALIPVFQYGVFCEGDCAFFNNPTLDFAGPVHANGDLYVGVASGNTITFHQKLAAYGNVVTNNLPNTLTASSTGDTGTVYIPYADGDCPVPGAQVTGNCAKFPASDGSVTGMGGNPPASSYNTAFNTFSASVNHEIINGNYGNQTAGNVGTGAKKLTLPFVTGTVHNYELIRRPTSLDSSLLSQAREYNMAQIRVLLSDDPNDLPGGSGDSNNVRLANLTYLQLQAQYNDPTISTGVNPWGITIAAGNYNATKFGNPPAGNTFNLYFAAASNAVPWSTSCTSSASCTQDWPFVPATTWNGVAQRTQQGLQPQPPPSGEPAAPIYSYTAPGGLSLGICPPASPTPGIAIPTGCPPTGTAPTYPYYGPPNAYTTTYNNSAAATSWSLIDGYLRVEYVDAAGTWHPVTTEWLQLGFARDTEPPTANGAGVPATGTANPITPNAILLLQAPADRDGNDNVTSTGTAPLCTLIPGSGVNKGKCMAWSAAVPEVIADTGVSGGEWAFGITPTTPSPGPPASSATPQSLTQYNWYPINFYDAREGEGRDVTTYQGGTNDTCSVNGLMNAVEIDVGNLASWLANSTSGKNVDYLAQNGYVLYFSDRRGMLLNPHPPMGGSAAKSGDSGLEDVINPGSSSNTPNGTLDTAEDVNQNGYLDGFGAANLGLGFSNDGATSLNATINPSSGAADNPFTRIQTCGTTGRKNWVSGARHVLKLVDGSLGNLPLSPPITVTNPDGTTSTFNGGFTVASENPVYIQDDYNSGPTDTFFTGATAGKPGADTTTPVHSPAAIVADTVTFLSDNWDDYNSMLKTPAQPQGNRQAASDTYYRVAVAAGKTLTFAHPSWENNGSNYPEGTDGGVGNFLRFLEDWNSGNSTMHYGGSIVEMFYNTYNTGAFKCCTYTVYQPPFRDYYFDPDFTTPQGLPPGTPLFRDVESLSYRQLFAARGYNGN